MNLVTIDVIKQLSFCLLDLYLTGVYISQLNPGFLSLFNSSKIATIFK